MNILLVKTLSESIGNGIGRFDDYNLK